MARPVISLEGFVRKIANLDAAHSGAMLLFRGHAQKGYELSPSVFRSKNWAKSEHLMIRQLLASQPGEFTNDLGHFDQLVRAQHYGLPTRLLDVSYNPLVALYFACVGSPSRDGQVIVLKPNILKQKYFDSDVVSIVSAMAFLQSDEKVRLLDAVKKALGAKGRTDLFKKIDSVPLGEFNNHESVQKIVQMVRQHKPDFRPIVQPIDLVKIVSVVPKQVHARISAQNGAFLVYGLAKQSNELNMPDNTLEKLNVGATSKQKILKQLSLVGISDETLFPEIERTAIQIKKRYS